MVPEKGECNALEAEADARAVSGLTSGQPNVEGLAEMILVIVAGATGSRLFLGADGHEQFNLESLIALVGGEHAAGASEEGIVRRLCYHRKPQGAQELHPAVDPAFGVEAARRRSVIPTNLCNPWNLWFLP